MSKYHNAPLIGKGTIGGLFGIEYLPGLSHRFPRAGAQHWRFLRLVRHLIGFLYNFCNGFLGYLCLNNGRLLLNRSGFRGRRRRRRWLFLLLIFLGRPHIIRNIDPFHRGLLRRRLQHPKHMRDNKHQYKPYDEVEKERENKGKTPMCLIVHSDPSRLRRNGHMTCPRFLERIKHGDNVLVIRLLISAHDEDRLGIGFQLCLDLRCELTSRLIIAVK